jgi:nitroreductase/NAD-dependent dihydropyrimidine dehydrogenase PreA subunit
MPVITVDQEKCKRDGICVSECPARIIEMKNTEAHPSLIEGGEEFCINCGHCVAVCPHGALSIDTMSSSQCQPISKDLLPTSEQLDLLFRSRRSIRTYRDKPVDRDILQRLISFAQHAPTAHNLQSVEWQVIENKESVKSYASLIIDWMRWVIDKQPAIAQSMNLDRVIGAWESGVDRVLRSAPHLIVAHADASMGMSQANCVIALTHLELAAGSLGLGACWAGYFTAAAGTFEPIQKALALPDGHKTFGALMVGYPTYTYHRIPLRQDQKIQWR